MLPLADPHTLDALDFPAVRERLARHTRTDRAGARARELVPSADRERIRLDQIAVSETRALLAEGAFALPRAIETAELIARAARGSALGGEELRAIAVALAAAEAGVRRVRASVAPVLQARCAGAAELGAVIGPIDHAISEHGEVLDRASPALTRLRRGLARAHEEARERCQAILRSHVKAVQDAIVTMRGGRFVIPIKAEFSGQVPGVVHDTSATGHTLFVEPLAALEVNNRVRTMRIEEEREVARILAELSARIGARAAEAERNLEILADLDLLLARAALAEEMRAVAPVLVDEPRLAIVNGRHPLLGERAIAQSLALDDQMRFIVVSGPNMGGKTVSLKMTGLFLLMTACGMHLPADEGTTIGGFSSVRADIGDEQSIEQNASTFSAHLRRLREILDGADARTLVLIDEIASGTEPSASAALAIALIEHLLACDARGIVTTHAGEVKLFAHDRARVRNASVRFDARTYRPTYELDIGAPGQSLAFPLARAMGLPDAVVARAESLLSENERAYDRALAELSELQAQAAAERAELARERVREQGLREELRRTTEAVERERATLARNAEERLARALCEFTSELERRSAERVGGGRPRVTSGQAALLGRVLEEVHHDLGLRPQAQPAAKRTQAAVGDVVFVDAFGREGNVVEDHGDSVIVALGAMRATVAKRDLRIVRAAPQAAASAPASPAARRASAAQGSATFEIAASARHELDVRGKRYTEAEPLVDRWLDEASLLGLSPLRLIHGKGTGLLGRGLREFLKDHPAVGSLRYGNPDEGGSGVTIVELR